MTPAEARFTELVRRDGPRVLAYLARRTVPPADAADVLSEVFTTAWRRVSDLPEYDEEASAWLFGIARRVLANQRRSRRRASGLADRLRQHLETAVPAGDLASIEAMSVRAALDRLPVDDRELLILIAWDGLRCDEAAVVLEVSPVAVRQRLVRARRRLREHLAEEEAEDDTAAVGRK